MTSKTNKKPKPGDKRLYELEACLFTGPVSEKFVKANPVISRTIQIRGDQTLQDLHKAIFDAFDRFDEHMYEFQLGGKGPADPKADRYVLPVMLDGPYDDGTAAGDLTRTAISSLGLKVDQVFGYRFDFGDNWWHQIDVAAIHDETPRGRYPKVIKTIGDSPPQYMDWDEEE